MHLLRKVQTGFRVSVGADLLLSGGLLALLLCAGPVGGLCSGRSLFADVEVTLSQGPGLFFAGRLGCSRRGAPHCGLGPLAQVPGALWRFSVCGSTGVRHPSLPPAPGTHTLAESPELVAFPAKLCSCCFPNHLGVPSFYGSACVSHGDTYSLHPRVHPPPPSGLVSASPVKLLASAVGAPHTPAGPQSSSALLTQLQQPGRPSALLSVVL